MPGRNRTRHGRKNHGHENHGRENGMSMIELMMAITLLAVGMSGAMILISASIASNNRNKFDTTATNLSEMVLERIAAGGVDSSSSFTISDCVNNTLTINTAGSTTGLGAALVSSGNTAGSVDFSVTPTSGYSVNYVTCRSARGTRATYNIRWNIKVLLGTDTAPKTKQITVATRQIGAANNTQLWFFGPPVTLRTVVGKEWKP